MNAGRRLSTLEQKLGVCLRDHARLYYDWLERQSESDREEAMRLLGDEDLHALVTRSLAERRDGAKLSDWELQEIIDGQFRSKA